MRMLKCCTNPGFTKDAVSNKIYCKPCFIDMIENKVRKTINKYNMIAKDDKIAVGYSGGKDSTVLLFILNKLEQRFPKSRITAITIDEGIAGYRDTCMDITVEITKKYHIKHEILTFKDIYGVSLDEIINLVSSRPHSKSPCAICGILRRKALNYGARKIGATKLATGHNLDDEAQSIIMNLLRGDSAKFIRLVRTPRKRFSKLIPRIRPLVFISEPEIVRYAFARNLKYHDVPCPYAPTAMRNDIRDFLTSAEQKHPGTLANIVRAHDSINQAIPSSQNTIPTRYCKECGDLTNREICPACELFNQLEIDPPYKKW